MKHALGHLTKAAVDSGRARIGQGLESADSRDGADALMCGDTNIDEERTDSEVSLPPGWADSWQVSKAASQLPAGAIYTAVCPIVSMFLLTCSQLALCTRSTCRYALTH